MWCANTLKRDLLLGLARYVLNYNNVYSTNKKLLVSICFLFSLQLEDGDIVCFQKSLSTEARQKLRCPDARSFFEYRHNLQVLFIYIWWIYVVYLFCISYVLLLFIYLQVLCSCCQSIKHSSLCWILWDYNLALRTHSIHACYELFLINVSNVHKILWVFWAAYQCTVEFCQVPSFSMKNFFSCGISFIILIT